VINTEWGNLNMTNFRNRFDVAIDESSDAPGFQTFEKMISGMYLGELLRVTVIDPQVSAGFSPSCLKEFTATFAEKQSFATALMSAIEADDSPDLAAVAKALREAGVHSSTLRDRVLMREICVCISTRAARLSAVGIGGLMELCGTEGHSTVAVDGTVFECYPFFKERMEAGLEDLLGSERAHAIELVLAKDGSGVGAAIIAALASE